MGREMAKMTICKINANCKSTNQICTINNLCILMIFFKLSNPRVFKCYTNNSHD